MFRQVDELEKLGWILDESWEGSTVLKIAVERGVLEALKFFIFKGAREISLNDWTPSYEKLKSVVYGVAVAEVKVGI